MNNSTSKPAIRVRVFAFRKAPELPVQLSVSPEFVDLSDVEEKEVTLEWRIQTNGFHFPSDGTAIVFTSPGSKETFERAETRSDGDCKDRVAVVSVRNVTGLAYAYTVSVIDDKTGLTTSLDPGVQVRSM